MNGSWLSFAATPEENLATVERVSSGAGLTRDYLVLLLLSTLIAAYGLLSNSTATVIGAMIVAPLMGPILGLAMGMVRGDSATFYRSLWAELLGVLLVVLTGAAVAFLVSPENIDYFQSEIQGRVRPTLFDMAIGLTAGLAGAYCSVSPRLQPSIAGVAIAVALVPPLTVTGLTLAGAFQGNVPWNAALGSFMLFFANFLTIEMAAVLVFVSAGLGEVHHVIGRRGFGAAFRLQLVLLLFTAAFLAHQLNTLVQERRFHRLARQVITSELRLIPGANLDSLQAEIDSEQGTVSIVAIVGSRQEIAPATVRRMEAGLSGRLLEEGEQLTPRIVVRTVQSVYASSQGLLYEPPQKPADPQQVHLQRLEAALREGLRAYPGTELESFRQLAAEPVQTEVLVTVVSPYSMEPRLVAQLERRVNELISAREAGGEPIRLTVRSLYVRSATAQRDVEYAAPEPRTTDEIARERRESQILDQLRALVEHTGQARLLETQLREEAAAGASEPRRYTIRAVIETPMLYSYSQVVDWEGALSRSLGGPVALTVENRVGKTLESADPGELLQARRTERIRAKLAALASTIPGAALVDVTVLPLRGTLLAVEVTVLSPKLLDASVLRSWEESLARVNTLAGEHYRIRLVLRNQLGTTYAQPQP